MRSFRQVSPPRAAYRLLRRVLPRGTATDSLLGDLHEEYVRFRPPVLRDLWYVGIAIRLVVGALTNLLARLRGVPEMLHRGLAVDVRHAVRRLRATPGFAVLACATLALGIGATTATFSLAHAIWLNPLPYRDPSRLVTIADVHQASGARGGSSASEFEDLSGTVTSFAGTAACSYGALIAKIGGEPVRVVADRVSPNLFQVLGVQPALGRDFTTADVATSTVIVSDATWRTRLHGARDVVGTLMLFNGVPFTVVGVMPRGFRFPLDLESEVWLPTDFHGRSDRAQRYMDVVARLRPGVTVEGANRELKAVASRLAQREPSTNDGWTITVESVEADTSARYEMAFSALLGIVGLFLLVACANLANLFLARNSTRRVELAVSTALGATQGRLARELFVESALVAATGGLIGVALTAGAHRLFTALMPTGTPRLGDLEVSPTVLAFAIGTTAATSVVTAILPALSLRSPSLTGTLSVTRTAGAPSRRTQRGLIVVEVALAAILLVGASLMLRNFVALMARDRGYVPHGVLTLNASLPFSDERYRDPATRTAALNDLLARVAAVPGATVVGATTGFPGSKLGMIGAGAVAPAVGSAAGPVIAVVHSATPEYFRAMGTPIERGRSFRETDSAAAPRVVIVNDTLAHQVWPGGDAVGKRLQVPAILGLPPDEAEVVGVVGDMHLGVRRVPELFVPMNQTSVYWLDLVVRTDLDPASIAGAVRRALRASNPDLLIENVSSLDRILLEVYGLQRAQTLLTALVATLALVMATMGIYALLTHAIAQRTRELGVRLALGSTPRALCWLVFREGLLLTAIGITVGLGAAVAIVRATRAQVFGLQSADVQTFAIVGASLSVVAAGVTWWSARRVTRIDPLVAIRQP